jgi:hypothetical protein
VRKIRGRKANLAFHLVPALAASNRETCAGAQRSRPAGVHTRAGCGVCGEALGGDRTGVGLCQYLCFGTHTAAATCAEKHIRAWLMRLIYLRMKG